MKKSFHASLLADIEQQQKNMANKVVEVAQELFSDIITRTPFLTGNLIGNWNASVRGHITTLNHQTFSSKDAATTATITRMKSAINAAAFMGRDGKAYLTNATDYSFKIEYQGWSRYKAPLGMVRVSIVSITYKYK